MAENNLNLFYFKVVTNAQSWVIVIELSKDSKE